MSTGFILHGDCLDVLKQCADDSVDLIFTSPPYAEQRKNTYGGIPVGNYHEWFLARSDEFRRVLKPTGTFILNIKEHVHRNERSTYVIGLIPKLRSQGWMWTEEFMWHKTATMPGKWSNRFRDCWERLLQFNKSKNFNMYQDEVKVPIKQTSRKRYASGQKETDKHTRKISSTKSNFGATFNNFVPTQNNVYPSNVISTSSEYSNQEHPAAFPVALPSWFIRLFTQQGDLVLDPFVGSGTTAVAAKRLRRRWIGIDVDVGYCGQAEDRLNTTMPMIVKE